MWSLLFEAHILLLFQLLPHFNEDAVAVEHINSTY